MSVTPLQAPEGPPARSWELWMRGRGSEVVVMLRIGRKVSEVSLSGDREALAVLGEVLAVVSR